MQKRECNKCIKDIQVISDGYLKLNRLGRTFIVSFPPDVSVIQEITGIVHERLIARCLMKDGGNMIRWIDISAICHA